VSALGPPTCCFEVRGPADELRLACAVDAPDRGLLVIDVLAWLHIWARRRDLRLHVLDMGADLAALVEFSGLNGLLSCERGSLAW
jgi:hypothetical protein